jgi:hypothetical protein
VKKNLLFVLGIALAIVCIPVAQAQVSCSAYDRPVGTGYIEATRKCDIGMTLFQDTTTCKNTDGSTAATFNPSLNVRHAGVSGWVSWSQPPDAESPTPWVGFNPGSSGTVTLTNAAAVAGFELEPNLFQVFTVTVSFRDAGGTQIASVTRSVDGQGGARLFGVNCCEQVIKSMVVSIDPAAQGYAIGQIRADTILGGAEPVEEMQPLIDPDEVRDAASNAVE